MKENSGKNRVTEKGCNYLCSLESKEVSYINLSNLGTKYIDKNEKEKNKVGWEGNRWLEGKVREVVVNYYQFLE